MLPTHRWRVGWFSNSVLLNSKHLFLSFALWLFMYWPLTCDCWEAFPDMSAKSSVRFDRLRSWWSLCKYCFDWKWYESLQGNLRTQKCHLLTLCSLCKFYSVFKLTQVWKHKVRNDSSTSSVAHEWVEHEMLSLDVTEHNERKSLRPSDNAFTIVGGWRDRTSWECKTLGAEYRLDKQPCSSYVIKPLFCLCL